MYSILIKVYHLVTCIKLLVVYFFWIDFAFVTKSNNTMQIRICVPKKDEYRKRSLQFGQSFSWPWSFANLRVNDHVFQFCTLLLTNLLYSTTIIIVYFNERTQLCGRLIDVYLYFNFVIVY